MDNRPIGIFDSGVGGLSAVSELIRQAPNESFVYFGDTLRAPYGDRPAEEIRLFSRRNARFLRSRDVKALIVACNTSTASALPELTAHNRDIPVVGTVAPTSAEAARVSAGNIGILATGAVVKSRLYERTIQALLPGARVTSVACPRLVPLIEAGHTAPGDGELMDALAEYLAPMKQAEVDTLVLGCTHYPLVRGAVLAAMGRDLPLVDSGGACVGAVLAALRQTGSLASPMKTRTEAYFCSARREDFSAVAKGFLGRAIDGATRLVDIEGF